MTFFPGSQGRYETLSRVFKTTAIGHSASRPGLKGPDLDWSGLAPNMSDSGKDTGRGAPGQRDFDCLFHPDRYPSELDLPLTVIGWTDSRSTHNPGETPNGYPPILRTERRPERHFR